MIIRLAEPSSITIRYHCEAHATNPSSYRRQPRRKKVSLLCMSTLIHKLSGVASYLRKSVGTLVHYVFGGSSASILVRNDPDSYFDLLSRGEAIRDKPAQYISMGAR